MFLFSKQTPLKKELKNEVANRLKTERGCLTNSPASKPSHQTKPNQNNLHTKPLFSICR